MRHAIGIDVGGTSVKAGLVREDGQVTESAEFPLPAPRGFDELLGVLEQIVSAHSPVVDAVGMGIPGAVSGPEGKVVVEPPQLEGLLGWKAARWLEEKSGCPAIVENDATAAAMGEASALGLLQVRGTLLLVTLGTGLGGGIVIDGRPLRGRFGTGGEIGHAIFEPRGLSTPKHAQGAFELYASATALLRRYRERGGSAESAREVIEGILAGDLMAQESLIAMAIDLGIGIASAAALLAPDVIVIGGGLSVLGEALRAPVAESYARHALPLVRDTPVQMARLGNSAGLVGAALIALHQG